MTRTILSLTGALALSAGCKGEPLPATRPQPEPPPAPTTAVDPPKPPETKEAPSLPPIDPPVTNCNVTKPDVAITPALLTSGLPCAVTNVPPFDLANLQHGFDYYSWLTFLALNAPASGGLPIGGGSGPGGDAPTLWESWRELSDIMLPGGATPPPWDAPRQLPRACEAIVGAQGMKVFRMVGKTPDLLEEVNQPFDTGPLIDQNGAYVRYEILVNRPMFEYIVQNKLYSKAGQAAMTAPVVFPGGDVTSGSDGTVGAIMAKAAWKVLGAGDDATRFHTAEALVYNPPVENPKIEESCAKATLGLVGLHLAHKTEAEPQWVWSTFEHVDNAPSAAEAKQRKFRKRYNFYKAGCAAKTCPVNQPPPRPWDPNKQPFPGGFTSQIVRELPIDAEVVALNAAFQALLPGKVWQNYMLISTQWPTDAKSKTDPNGVPAPVFLANTTMETYIQGSVPQSSSSCMACHGNAAATSGRPSDFTYILERAN